LTLPVSAIHVLRYTIRDEALAPLSTGQQRLAIHSGRAQPDPHRFL
jgi:hypothetical protein